MKERLQRQVAYFNKEHNKASKRTRLKGILGLAVVLVVLYALLLPAFTLEKPTYCGLEEHTHTEECYAYVLDCPYEKAAAGLSGQTDDGSGGAATGEDAPDHAHGTDDSSASAAHGGLDPQAATPSNYIETVSAYETTASANEASDIADQISVPAEEVSDNISGISVPAEEVSDSADETSGSSALENADEEEHESEVYIILEDTDSDGNTAEGHVHTAECYKKVLICDEAEHTHTLECYSDADADVESIEDIEELFPDFAEGEYRDSYDYFAALAAFQKGYRESGENYQIEVAEDGKESIHGYTRYGDWANDPYTDDWANLYVGFTAEEAGLDITTFDSDTEVWFDNLQEAELYRPIEDYLPVDYESYLTEDEDGSLVLSAAYEADGNPERLIPGDLVILDLGDNEAIREDSFADDDHTDDRANGTSGKASGSKAASTAAADADELDSLPDHIGILTKIDYRKQEMKLMVGDLDHEVQEIRYDLNDLEVLGFARLPETEEAIERNLLVHGEPEELTNPDEPGDEDNEALYADDADLNDAEDLYDFPGIADFFVDADGELFYTMSLADGQMLRLAAANAQTTTSDLRTLLANATLTVNGRVLGDELWTVKKGEPYELHLQFTEIPGSYQFDTDAAELVYQLPNGFTPSEAFTSTFTLKDNDGNSYDGNEFTVDAGGRIHIRFTEEAREKIADSGNTNFTIDLKGIISDNVNKLEFSDGITRTVDIDDSHHVSVQKSGYYSAEDDKVHYTVTVYSDGTSENVVVKDTVSGTALTYDQNAAVSGADTSYIINSSDGFEVQIPSMSHGQTVTISYTASVDHSQISGKGTVEETENDVTVKAKDDPGETRTTDLNNQIDYQTLSKTSGTPSGNGEIKTVPWTIVVNEAQASSMAGKKITDRIAEASQDVMHYSGPVTIEVYNESGTKIDTRSVTPADNAVSWTYQIPSSDTGKYKYVITYNTVVDTSGVIGNLTVNNTVTDGDHTIGGGSSVPSSTEVHLTKSHEEADVTDTEITWTISFTVPAGGLSKAVITDTYPSTWGRYYDSLKYNDSEPAISIDGLQDGETWDFAEAVDQHSCTITFYKSDNKTEENAGLNGSGSERTITIRLTTELNQEWIEAFPVSYDATSAAHTNHVNLNNAVFDSDTVTPIVPSIDKKASYVGTAADSDGNPLPVYMYEITVTGVQEGEDLHLTDAYDSHLRYLDVYRAVSAADGEGNPVTTYPDNELLMEAGGQNGHWWYERLFGNEGSWGNKTAVAGIDGGDAVTQLVITADESAHKLTFDCTADNIPKKENGSLYNSYTIYYFLIANNYAALSADTLQADEGKLVMPNTITWGSKTDTASVTHEYNGLSKNEIAYDSSRNVSTFQIVLNPDKKMLLEGYNAANDDGSRKMLTMTDTYTNLSVDYSTIQWTTEPKGREADITFNYRGSTGTFQIPDETKVILTYEARVIGEGTVTYSNLATMAGYVASTSNTRQMSGAVGGDIENNKLRLFKYAEGDMTKALSGAVYTLVDETGTPILYPSSAGTGKAGTPVTFTTGLNGYVDIFLSENEDGISLQKGLTYYLKETTAPRGPNGETYQLDPIIYRFTLMDQPDYSKYEYYQNDIMKVVDKPAKGVIVLEKSVQDTAGSTLNLTEEQKKEITFTIKKVDPSNHDIIDDSFTPLTISYADFTNGSYRLDNLETGHYMVAETAFNVDGYEHKETDINLYYYQITKEGGIETLHNEDERYKVSEDSSVSYDQAKVKVEEFDITNSAEHKVAYINKYSPNGTSIIVKKISDDETPIDLYGAEFELQVYDQVTETWVPYQGGALQNTNGKFTIGYENRSTGVTISGLENRDYRLVETKAPDGYQRLTEAVSFHAENGQITIKGQEAAQETGFILANGSLSVTNAQQHTYTIEKVQAGSLETRLYGAEFSLYEYQNDDAALAVYTTDENGRLSVDWLEGYAGGTAFDSTKIYYLKETKAPVGYTLPSNPPKYFFYNSSSTDASFASRVAATRSASGFASIFNLALGPKESVVYNTMSSTSVSVIKKWMNHDGGYIDAPVNTIEYKIIQIIESKDAVTGGDYKVEEKQYPDENTTFTISGIGGYWQQDNVLTDLPTGDSKDGRIAYYSYIVEEVTDIDGFIVEYADNNKTEVQKQIINKPEPMRLTVHKTWSDNTPAERIQQVHVQVYRDPIDTDDPNGWYYTEGGVKWVPVGQARPLNRDNGWTTVFENLTKGNIYHIVETNIDTNQFDVRISGGNTFTDTDDVSVEIENVYKLIDITVNKQWVATPAGDQSNVYVKLYRDTLEGEAPDYTEGEVSWIHYSDAYTDAYEDQTNNGSCTWKGLPADYTYHVVETGVSGKTFENYHVIYDAANAEGLSVDTSLETTITNILKDDTSLSVYKVWDDKGQEDERPDSVQISLVREAGSSTGHLVSVTVNSANDRVDKYGPYLVEDGSAFTGYLNYYVCHNGLTYTVNGTEGSGIVAESNDFGGETRISLSDIREDKVIVINSPNYHGDPGYQNGLKITVCTPAAVTLDGTDTVIDTVVLNDSNGWYKKWSNLPVVSEEDSAVVYAYTVEELSVDGYESVITGGEAANGLITVTNTKTESDMTKVRVEKNWVNETDTWPEGVEIEFTLLANGAAAAVSEGQQNPMTLTAENPKGVWTDLPKEDASGNTITYTVAESPVSGYDSYYKGVSGKMIKAGTAAPVVGGRASFTNILQTTSIRTNKSWSGLDGAKVTVQGQDGERDLADYLTVILYLDRKNADGTLDSAFHNDPKYGPVSVNKANGWSYDWDSLPFADENGNPYTYTVREADVILSDDVLTSNTLVIPDSTPRSVRDQFAASTDRYDLTNTWQDPTSQLTITKTITGLEDAFAGKTETEQQAMIEQISFRVSGQGFTAQTKTLKDFTANADGSYTWTLTKADGIRKGVEYTVIETNNLSVSGKVVSTNYTVTADDKTTAASGETAKITMNTSDSGTVAYTNRYSDPQSGDGELEIQKEWGSAFTDSDKKTVKVALYRREVAEKPGSGNTDTNDTKTIKYKFYDAFNPYTFTTEEKQIRAKVGNTIKITISMQGDNLPAFTFEDSGYNGTGPDMSSVSKSGSNGTAVFTVTVPDHNWTQIYSWFFRSYDLNGKTSGVTVDINALNLSGEGDIASSLYVDSSLTTQAQVVAAGGEVVLGYEAIEISSASGWSRIITGLPTTNGEEGDALRYYVYYIVEENGDVYGATYAGTNGSITVKNNDKPEFTDITVKKEWKNKNGETITDNLNRTGSAEFLLMQVAKTASSASSSTGSGDSVPIQFDITGYNGTANGKIGDEITFEYTVTFPDESKKNNFIKRIDEENDGAGDKGVKLVAHYYELIKDSGEGHGTAVNPNYYPTIVSGRDGGYSVPLVIRYTIPTTVKTNGQDAKVIAIHEMRWEDDAAATLVSDPVIGEAVITIITKESEYGTFTLSSGENWTKIFTDLPKTSADGKTTYTYYVKEVNPESSVKTVAYTPGESYDVTTTEGTANAGQSAAVDSDSITVTNTEEVTDFTIQKRWQIFDGREGGTGNTWNADYGQDATIYFKLYKIHKITEGSGEDAVTTIDEKVQVDANGAAVESGGLLTLTAEDTVNVPDAYLSTTDNGIERGVVKSHFPKNADDTYPIPFMRTFTLPQLAGGWEYIAVECDSTGKDLTENLQYWTCSEFGPLGAYTLKNNLEDEKAVKNWEVPDTGEYYHPALTFTLYRKEIEVTSEDAEDTLNTKVDEAKVPIHEDGKPDRVNTEGFTVFDIKSIPAGIVRSDSDITAVEWKDLPKFNLENGNRYVYVIDETGSTEPYSYGGVTVSNTTWTFTNKLENLNLYVRKQWIDEDGNVIPFQKANDEDVPATDLIRWWESLPQSISFRLWQVGYSDPERTTQKSRAVDITPEAGLTIAKPETISNDWLTIVGGLPKASIDVNGETTYFGYYVVEETPAGFLPTYQTEQMMATDPATDAVSVPANAIVTDMGKTGTVIRNTQFDISVDIVKVDSKNTEKKLNGAKFKLVRYTDDTFQEIAPGGSGEEKTVEEDGKVSFDGIVQGYYKIVETQTPAGYILTTGDAAFRVYLDADNNPCIEFLDSANGMVSFEPARAAVAEDPETGTEAQEAKNPTFTVKNEPGAELPSSGGRGTRLFPILGSILILGAGMLLWRRRKLIS